MSLMIRYQNSEADTVRATFLISRKKSWGIILLPGIGVLMFVGGIVSMIWPGLIAQSARSNVTPILLGIGLMLSPLFIAANIRKAFRKMPIMQECRTLTIDDDFLRFESQSSNVELSWSVFIRLLEDKYNFVLMQQGNLHGVPISKRTLDASEIDGLRAFLRARLPVK